MLLSLQTTGSCQKFLNCHQILILKSFVKMRFKHERSIESSRKVHIKTYFYYFHSKRQLKQYKLFKKLTDLYPADIVCLFTIWQHRSRDFYNLVRPRQINLVVYTNMGSLQACHVIFVFANKKWGFPL